MLVFLFAAIAAAAHLPDRASDFGPVAVSAAAQPMHTALLSKKEASRAILSAERRQGIKIRWSDPLDALLPADFALQDYAPSAITPTLSTTGLTEDCFAAFRARAPPLLTV